MPIDTVTQLIPPAEAAARIRSRGQHPAALAETRTLVVEDARSLQKPEYQGRHRTTDDVDTRIIPAQKGAVDASHPAKVPARLRQLAALLRALPRGRGRGGEGGGR